MDHVRLGNDAVALVLAEGAAGGGRGGGAGGQHACGGTDVRGQRPSGAELYDAPRMACRAR